MIRLIVLMLLACLTYQSEAAKKYLGKNPGPVSRRLNSFVDYGSIKNVDYGSIKKDQLNKLESQLSHLEIKLFICFLLGASISISISTFTLYFFFTLYLLKFSYIASYVSVK